MKNDFFFLVILMHSEGLLKEWFFVDRGLCLSSWRTTHLKLDIYKIYLIYKNKRETICIFLCLSKCSWSSKISEYLQEYFWKISHICNWTKSDSWSKWWKVALNIIPRREWLILFVSYNQTNVLVMVIDLVESTIDTIHAKIIKFH